MGKQLGRRIYPDRAHNFIDMTGQKFGRLTVMSLAPKPEGCKRSYWICRCDCGNISKVDGAKLRFGHTRSCGCLLVEFCVNTKTTHGGTSGRNGGDGRGTPEYKAWQGMKNRCRYKTMESYYLYGGRGIKVCARWWNSFENFLADMGPKPGPHYSLERKDNNKDYCPENCKWADRWEQANNKRNNRKIVHDGRTMNLFQWAREFGLDPKRLHARLASGWSFEKSVTTPIRKWPT